MTLYILLSQQLLLIRECVSQLVFYRCEETSKPSFYYETKWFNCGFDYSFKGFIYYHHYGEHRGMQTDAGVVDANYILP